MAGNKGWAVATARAGTAGLETPLGWARMLLKRAVDLVAPPLCAACRRPITDPRTLCAPCWRGLTLITAPVCDITGNPLAYDAGPGARSAELAWNHPLYDRARAAVVLDRVSRRLVHQLKYHDVPGIAPLMARLMVPAVRDVMRDADCLVPVPLHPRRLAARRFNQAVLLADHLGQATGVPVVRYAVQRTRHTPHQVGLGRTARANNLHHAFTVRDREQIAGRRIVVVDDVLTTGATADAMATALRVAGARSVSVAVFARAIADTSEPV